MRFLHSLTYVAAAAVAPAAFGQDECATAMPVSDGDLIAFDTTTATQSALGWNCAGTGAPDLWYSITSANGGRITFETCGSSYDTALEAFEGTCGSLSLLICNDDVCGFQSTLSFDSVPGQTYFVRVGGYNGATGPGTLIVNEGAFPNLSLVDSVAGNFIDISTTGNPLALADDGEADFVTTVSNPVFQAGTVRIGSNGGIRFFGGALELSYINSSLPSSDAFLAEQALLPFWDDFDTDGGNDGEIYVQEVGGVLIVQWEAAEFYPGGSGGIDVATFQVQVPSGTGPVVAQFLYESVDSPRADHGAEATVGYQGNEVGGFTDVQWSDNEPNSVQNGLVLTLTMGSGPIGTNYCAASPNSTGATGAMSATGSASVTANDLTLVASDLPQNAFGFFLVSDLQGFVPNPGGSSGNLCLGGQIGRYVGPGQIQNTGASDEITLLVDNQAIPTPTGLVAVMAGDVLNFQAWHRDVSGAGATSNFTDGLEIAFY